MNNRHISSEDNSRLRLLLVLTPYAPVVDVALSRLRRELDRISVGGAGFERPAAVTMGSLFHYEDLDTGVTGGYVLCFPEEAAEGAGRLSILTPLGTAVIGCSIGDVVCWAIPACNRRIAIRRVFQPFASSRLDDRFPARTGMM